jgi:hypothetical protein
VLGVLCPFPLVADVISNPALTRHLDQIGPLLASLDAQATIGVKGLAAHPEVGPRRRHPVDRRRLPPRRARPEIPAMHDAYVPGLSACT